VKVGDVRTDFGVATVAADPAADAMHAVDAHEAPTTAVQGRDSSTARDCRVRVFDGLESVEESVHEGVLVDHGALLILI